MVIGNLKKAFADDVAIAYVYFDYKNQFEQNASSVLARLMRQITIQSKQIPESVLES
jgi:hypothetical protein